MKRKILELLGFPISKVEFEIDRSLEEIAEIEQWVMDTKYRLEKLRHSLEEL